MWSMPSMDWKCHRAHTFPYFLSFLWKGHFRTKSSICTIKVCCWLCALHLSVGRVNAMVLTKKADCLDMICIVFLHLAYSCDFTVVQVLNVSPYVNDHKYSDFLARNIICNLVCAPLCLLCGPVTQNVIKT